MSLERQYTFVCDLCLSRVSSTDFDIPNGWVEISVYIRPLRGINGENAPSNITPHICPDCRRDIIAADTGEDEPPKPERPDMKHWAGTEAALKEADRATSAPTKGFIHGASSTVANGQPKEDSSTGTGQNK